ncbi:hypothetical protein M9980_10025 [Sphingomonas donggukensis]|uniref:Twin-arginine translocation signal domain-containing protein n=1 Tax=Sphingomonas donggukensis TaxID=2949093 RepID=A0ABY4TWI8_9SPHN|nr:hypothetical protein [Sphingomonas donggukensis]URW74901.1 hypothetical protein M9980_10025 [Sphingomonas donggukensis]
MAHATIDAVDTLVGPVSRRGFIGRCAVAPVAGIAAGSVASGAAAAVAGGNVRGFTGKYAIDSHRIIDGFFAAPRGRTGMDVVVVLPTRGAPAGAAEATARSYAAQGWLAIAPNLAATYKGAALLGQPAMVAAMMRDLPRLKRHARGSGRVAVVAA